MKNLFSKVVDQAKDIASNATEKAVVTKDIAIDTLSKAGIDREIIEALISGGFLVKSSFIEQKVRDEIDKAEGISLKKFFIEEDGIHLSVTIKKLLISLSVDIVLHIDEVIINNSEQSIICSIKLTKSKENPFIDMLIKPIIDAILVAVLKQKTGMPEMVTDIKVKDGVGKVTVDISNVSGIKLLLVTIPVFMVVPITPITLLAFDNFQHSNNGIVIKGRLVLPSL